MPNIINEEQFNYGLREIKKQIANDNLLLLELDKIDSLHKNITSKSHIDESHKIEAERALNHLLETFANNEDINFILYNMKFTLQQKLEIVEHKKNAPSHKEIIQLDKDRKFAKKTIEELIELTDDENFKNQLEDLLAKGKY